GTSRRERPRDSSTSPGRPAGFPPETTPPPDPPPKSSSEFSPWSMPPQGQQSYQQLYYGQPYFQSPYDPMSQHYEQDMASREPPSSSSYNSTSSSPTQANSGQQTWSGTAGQGPAPFAYVQPPYNPSPCYNGSATQQQGSNPHRGYPGISQGQRQGVSVSNPYVYQYPAPSGAGAQKNDTKKRS
ncbi:MAG: hypothetical protein M1830_003555, partial [Pleopsidium flavum]